MNHTGAGGGETDGHRDDHDRELLTRYALTRELVADAAQRHGRSANDVGIVTVSKFQPARAIAELADAGQRDFGENYIQEALRKQRDLGRRGLHWHFLGRLQRNKVKYLPGNFTMFHGLDDSALALDLHKLFRKNDLVLDVLLQVNLGRESQKGGILPENLPVLAEGVLGLPGLALQGLMTLPPFELDLAEKQRLFGELRQLRDNLSRRVGLPLTELSMGTTDDFPAAIAEGATIVRIGTRIFGERPA